MTSPVPPLDPTPAVMRPRPTTRPWTPDKRIDGKTRLHVKRCCNGCHRALGDVTDAEMDAAIAGLPLPDVRDECGCSERLS